MNYNYKLENLGCANCANKMEVSIKKIKGVKDCTINFFLSKMKIEMEVDMSDDIFNQIQKMVNKIEPGTKLKEI